MPEDPSAVRYPADRARPIAQDLHAKFFGSCVRIVIAGSLRRLRPDVGDLELVALPRWGTASAPPDPSNLFALAGEEPAEPVRVNTLYETCKTLPIDWIRGFDPAGKNWKGRLRPEVRGVSRLLEKMPAGTAAPTLDLWIAGPENYGWILAIRTGSGIFSKALAAHAKKIGRPSRDGYLRAGPEDDTIIPTPTEEEVFRVLGLRFIEPNRRNGWDDIRPL